MQMLKMFSVIIIMDNMNIPIQSIIMLISRAEKMFNSYDKRSNSCPPIHQQSTELLCHGKLSYMNQIIVFKKNIANHMDPFYYKQAYSFISKHDFY